MPEIERGDSHVSSELETASFPIAYSLLNEEKDHNGDHFQKNLDIGAKNSSSNVFRISPPALRTRLSNVPQPQQAQMCRRMNNNSTGEFLRDADMFSSRYMLSKSDIEKQRDYLKKFFPGLDLDKQISVHRVGFTSGGMKFIVTGAPKGQESITETSVRPRHQSGENDPLYKMLARGRGRPLNSAEIRIFQEKGEVFWCFSGKPTEKFEVKDQKIADECLKRIGFEKQTERQIGGMEAKQVAINVWSDAQSVLQTRFCHINVDQRDCVDELVKQARHFAGQSRSERTLVDGVTLFAGLAGLPASALRTFLGSLTQRERDVLFSDNGNDMGMHEMSTKFSENFAGWSSDEKRHFTEVFKKIRDLQNTVPPQEELDEDSWEKLDAAPEIDSLPLRYRKVETAFLHRKNAVERNGSPQDMNDVSPDVDASAFPLKLELSRMTDSQKKDLFGHIPPELNEHLLATAKLNADDISVAHDDVIQQIEQRIHKLAENDFGKNLLGFGEEFDDTLSVLSYALPEMKKYEVSRFSSSLSSSQKKAFAENIEKYRQDIEKDLSSIAIQGNGAVLRRMNFWNNAKKLTE